jgi:hypothetical protein
VNREIATEKLRTLLEAVFDKGVSMTILANTQKTDYSPDEVSRIALHAYMVALDDVLAYLEGHPASLEELLTEDGPSLVLDTSQKVTVFHETDEDLDDEELQTEH